MHHGAVVDGVVQHELEATRFRLMWLRNTNSEPKGFKFPCFADKRDIIMHTWVVLKDVVVIERTGIGHVALVSRPSIRTPIMLPFWIDSKRVVKIHDDGDVMTVIVRLTRTRYYRLLV